MLNNYEEKFDEIEKLATDVYAMLSVTKNACQAHDYIYEETVLEYALKLQNEIIIKITDLNMPVII